MQAVLYEDKQTDFAGYNPLVIDVDMYRARNNNGQPQMHPIEVADLDKEITIQLPAVEGVDLTCAYFNEQAGDWEALNCANEVVTDEHITCCTDHLTRFALVPIEYLEVVRVVQQIEENQIEQVKTVDVVLSDSGRGINTKYLIGCICALVTLVATVLCLAKQICAFKTEKKRYEQLVREQSSEHHQAPQADDLAVPTERALMANDDDAVKP